MSARPQEPLEIQSFGPGSPWCVWSSVRLGEQDCGSISGARLPVYSDAKASWAPMPGAPFGVADRHFKAEVLEPTV